MIDYKSPKPGEIYRHFKGNLYQIITIATHTETEEQLVIYQALYGEFGIFARPLFMFLDEVQPGCLRFVLVNKKEIQETESTTKTSKPMFSLMDFLDAETYKEKTDIFRRMKNTLDDKTINDIAAALDIVVEETEFEDRYRSVLNCLNTMSRFECDRFR